MSEKREEGKKQLAEMNQKVQDALNLLTIEEVNSIIGERSEDLGKLLEAAQAGNGLLFAIAQGQGMRKNEKSIRTFGQSQLIFSQLILYAYALGVKKT